MPGRNGLGIVCAMILCLGIFSGCAKEERAAGPSESGAPATVFSGEGTDWMAGGLQKPPALSKDQNWTLLASWEPELPGPEFEYTGEPQKRYACLGSDFYVLAGYRSKENENTVFRLYYLDGETKECGMQIPFWEEQGLSVSVSSFEAVGQHKLAVLGQVSGEEKNREYLLLWDTQTKEGSMTDISSLQEIKSDTLQFGHWRWCDSRGYLYVVMDSPGETGKKLYVFGEKDTEGKAQLLRTIGDETGTDMRFYCRLADGTPLVYIDGRAMYIDMEKGGQRELASVGGMAREGIVNASGIEFSGWDSQINLWNPARKEYCKILKLKDYGLDTESAQGNSSDMLYMGCNNAGELMVLTRKEGREVISYFGPQEETTVAGALELANLYYHDSIVKSAAARYSVEHPECVINYLTGGEDSEGFYDRTLMEAATGKGADILFVLGEDMENLYAKGVLADLSHVLEEDTVSQLYSGVLPAGTRNGKLIGLPVSIAAEGLCTGYDVWSADSWSYEEALELWEQGRDKGVQCFLPENNSRDELLDVFLLKNIADSPFLDLEKGVCDFDNDTFRRILELIRDCSSREHRNLSFEEEAEVREQIKEGLFLAESYVYTGPIEYINAQEGYEGKADFPGYPAQSGEGNLLRCYGYLVVNAQTEHWEEAKEFLRFFYGKEFQEENSENMIPLRKDVLIDNREPYKEGEELYTLMNAVVPLKEDGSSYIEDFIAMMDRCRPALEGASDIQEIVREEADAYLNGNQDLEHTVLNIQNRVQLYLKENG